MTVAFAAPSKNGNHGDYCGGPLKLTCKSGLICDGDVPVARLYDGYCLFPRAKKGEVCGEYRMTHYCAKGLSCTLAGNYHSCQPTPKQGKYGDFCGVSNSLECGNGLVCDEKVLVPLLYKGVCLYKRSKAGEVCGENNPIQHICDEGLVCVAVSDGPGAPGACKIRTK